MNEGRTEPECFVCDDSGWRQVECRGVGVKLCGRRRDHWLHTFAVRCDCRDINRTYQEKRERHVA